uniref:THAP-type domain-containing protein n=1 Tax=Cyprinodon variegatus TaxID=28743 RepID=A0A3Q2E423_CYPVA
MARSCCVKGCGSTTSGKKGHSSIKFFRFPGSREDRGLQMEDISRRRRIAWVAAVRRKDITFNHISPNMRVCSLHFHKSQPAYEMMETDPDWAPSLRLGHTDLQPIDSACSARRGKRQQLRNSMLQEAERVVQQNGEVCGQHIPVDNELSAVTVLEDAITDKTGDTQQQDGQLNGIPECGTCILKCAEINRLLEENRDLRHQLDRVKFIRHYTGLPNKQTFMEIVSILVPATSDNKKLLTPYQMLLLTCMRLRLDVSVYLLANMFFVSPSTVYRAFSDTISRLYTFLKNAIIWPDRDTLRKVMPHQFVQSFGNRVARPSNVKACAQMFSSYKHNHTMKYLIGITPKGAICFLSKGWGGGRTYDKHITLNSGFLDKLLPGDIVLADRGFDIQENVSMLCAEVKLPAFTKGMCQLDSKNVEETRKIAHLRIHVERVIGNVNQKYKILTGTMPISLILPCEGEDVTLLDKVVTVCCALTNLCPSVCK